MVTDKWRKRTALTALTVAVLTLLAACTEDPAPAVPEDGTLTVRVTGAGDHDGAFFYYAVVSVGEDLAETGNWIGVAPTSPTISGGTVECLTEAYGGGGTAATFTGGEDYDAGGIIDVDKSGSITSGDYEFLETVTIDGDTTLELAYPGDFTFKP